MLAGPKSRTVDPPNALTVTDTKQPDHSAAELVEHQNSFEVIHESEISEEVDKISVTTSCEPQPSTSTSTFRGGRKQPWRHNMMVTSTSLATVFEEGSGGMPAVDC